MVESRSERVLEGQAVVPAAIHEVWNAWTTDQGVRSFFGPGSNVQLRVDGPYEIFFMPDAEPGMKGGDGMKVLAFQEPVMLSVTWNAPPSLPQARKQRTHVTIRLGEIDGATTRVTIHHDGWGDGGEWDKAFEYFDSAWNDVVLPRLVRRFVEGPVDWAIELG